MLKLFINLLQTGFEPARPFGQRDQHAVSSNSTTGRDAG